MESNKPEFDARDRIVIGLTCMAVTAFLFGPWTWGELAGLIVGVYVLTWVKAKLLARIPLLGGDR